MDWKTMLLGAAGLGGLAVLPFIWNMFLSREKVVKFTMGFFGWFKGIVLAYDVPVIGGKFEAGLKAKFLSTIGDAIFGAFCGAFGVDPIRLRAWLKDYK